MTMLDRLHKMKTWQVLIHTWWGKHEGHLLATLAHTTDNWSYQKLLLQELIASETDVNNDLVNVLQHTMSYNSQVTQWQLKLLQSLEKIIGRPTRPRWGIACTIPSAEEKQDKAIKWIEWTDNTNKDINTAQINRVKRSLGVEEWPNIIHSPNEEHQKSMIMMMHIKRRFWGNLM